MTEPPDGDKIDLEALWCKLRALSDLNTLCALNEMLDAFEYMRKHRKSGKVQMDVENGVAKAVSPRGEIAG